jgi:hypothetical protein
MVNFCRMRIPVFVRYQDHMRRSGGNAGRSGPQADSYKTVQNGCHISVTNLLTMQ